MSERKNNGSGSSATIQMRACPNCGKPPVHAFRPFCSKRCADIDLHRWFSGTYAVPVRADEDEDGLVPEAGIPDADEEPR